MQAVAYVPEKFPYTTKDAEMLAEIEKIIKSYTNPPALTDQAKGISFSLFTSAYRNFRRKCGQIKVYNRKH